MKVLVSLVLAAAVSAQSGSISGIVQDVSGATVANARVTVRSRSGFSIFTAQSDSSGRYTVPGSPSGDYSVEAYAEGFGSSDPIPVHLSANPLEVNIRLEVARVATRVEVTSQGFAQTVDQQSKASDTIEASQIEQRGEFSVAEALRSTPGLRVQQLGGPGSLTRILTRGMRPQDTSVLIDGFRLRDAASPAGDATAFIGDLLLADTDRIEVVRGSGSSLYGTHATAGVVNIITDQGGGGIRGQIEAEGGGLGLLRGLAKVAGGAWKDRFRYTGALTHLNLLNGVDGNDRTRNTVAQGSAQLHLASATVLNGRVLASKSFAQLNDSPFAITPIPAGAVVPAVAGRTFNPSQDDPDSRRAAHYISTLVGVTHSFTPAATLNVSYGGLTTRRDSRDGPGGNRFEPAFNTLDRYNGRIDTVQARTDLYTGNWNLITAGYEFEREQFENPSQDFNPNPAAQVSYRVQVAQRSHAVFLKDQVQLLNRRLQLSFSGRAQSFRLDQPQFGGGTPLYNGIRIADPPRALTGDASLAYSLASTGTKLRAHVGNGFRAPALYERFGSSFFSGYFSAYGDPNLRPDRLLAMDAGFDQYLASSRVRISGTYFYTRIQEAIFFDFSGAITPATDPYGRFGGYRNTRGGLARGAEISLEANPYRSLTLRSSYTYTRAQERTSTVAGGSLRSFRVSDHMFTATASQRIGRAIDVTLDFFGASDYTYPFSGRAFSFAGPKKTDLSANYTRAVTDRISLRFFTRVENLLNRTYYEDGFRTPGAWATGGMKLLF